MNDGQKILGMIIPHFIDHPVRGSCLVHFLCATILSCPIFNQSREYPVPNTPMFSPEDFDVSFISTVQMTTSSKMQVELSLHLGSKTLTRMVVIGLTALPTVCIGSGLGSIVYTLYRQSDWAANTVTEQQCIFTLKTPARTSNLYNGNL